MKKLIIKFLFRLLDGDTMKALSFSDKTKLSSKLAELCEDGIFIAWLNERELSIYKIWKSGVGNKDDIARGRILEIEEIKRIMKERHLAEKKRKEQMEESKRREMEKSR